MEHDLFESIMLLLILPNAIGAYVFGYVFKSEDHRYFGCPTYIYSHSKLNKFGVVMLFLILLILSPLYYLLWFGYWVFHVGRDKTKKPACLEEVKQFIYASLKSKYGDAVLSKLDKPEIVIDTEESYHGNTDVWIKMNYFH